MVNPNRFVLIKLLMGIVMLSMCARVTPASGESNQPAHSADQSSDQISYIMIRTDASSAERHAADELAKYIKEMTGQELPLVIEGQAKPAGRGIILGRTKANLQAHNPDDWPLDTIYIGYGEGDIAIIGQGEQGTLFAAYEFLRDQGCRWYMPSEIGEYIPQRQYLDLPDKPKTHTPSFGDRGWYIIPTNDTILFNSWAVRNGVNCLSSNYNSVEYLPELGYGRQKCMGHNLVTFVPSGNHPKTAELFAAHPERYPLVDGKREWQYKDGRGVQACLSNPEVVQEAARHAIDFFHQNPSSWLYTLGHNDEPSYWCECEACLAMDGPGSTWKANDLYDAYPRDSQCKNGPGAMSDRYVKFVNQVARIVAKEFPEKHLSFFAYGSTHTPPRDPNWTLEPNVVVEYADSGTCYRHAFDDPACQNNIELAKWLGGWTSRAKVICYQYPPMGSNFDLPTVFTHSYKRYLSYLKKIGVIGVAGENQGTWAGSALFHYLEARLLWDIDADGSKLVHEFCLDMYGPAAPAMESFYTTFEQELQGLPGHWTYGHDLPAFDNDTIQTLLKFLNQAGEQADSPLVHKRVNLMKIAMNCFILARMEAKPDDQANAIMPEDYNKLQSETLQLIEDINLHPNEQLVVTSQFINKIKNSVYRPPFEAMRGKELLTLPLVWRFRTDPNNEGLTKNWATNPSAETADWHDIRVDNYWTEQGFSYHGVAWYATTLKVPTDAENRLWLLFKVLDGDAEIWIDGQLVGELAGDPWDKSKAVELTKFVKAGGEYLVVVRVVKEVYAAGICGSVKLMESH